MAAFSRLSASARSDEPGLTRTWCNVSSAIGNRVGGISVGERCPPPHVETEGLWVPPGDAPLIAICMATHEPNEQLFERQVESIRRQSHQRLVCVISDDASSSAGWSTIRSATAADPRFFCTRSADRLGFYRNFERSLTLVPSEACFIAFADQDDFWYPDKLAVLTDSLRESGVMLAYCDTKVVSEDGALLATTYWRGRRNNHTDLASLLLMNTVTGAASVFRRELLDDALPFPPEVGRPYHDHWLACVALALGELAYTDEPLQDYVQHSRNLVGTYVPSGDFDSGLLRALLRLAASPRRRASSTVRNARRIYFEDVLRLEVLARTLEVRLGSRIQPSRVATVRRVARLSTSYRSLLWLLARSAGDLRGDSPSLGAENQLVKGIVWRRCQRLRLRRTL